ncbi:MAG: cysteine desulfurase family protein [Alphaproteobacteria bacterium]
MIYLDHNATAPILPAAAEAVRSALAIVGNASSVHRAGRGMRRVIEDAREVVAALVGGKASGVVFTSGGTEANNLALGGVERARVLVSAIEHPSVLGARLDAETVRVGRDGVVDLDALRRQLAAGARPALVSLMLANNETGVIQPVREAAEIAHEFGALVHCDAVQAVGRMPVDMCALGVDMLSMSSHKIGGPPGVGALVLADGVEIRPLIQGGGQERRRRAGTENAPGIAGFGAAAAALPRETATLSALRDGLERDLTAAVPLARIFGVHAPRLPNTTCIAMPGVQSETQVMAFDLEGFAVSAGAACSSGKVEASHVLRAMGVGEAEARTAIRVSLGWQTTADDVARFVEAWTRLYRRLGLPSVGSAA